MFGKLRADSMERVSLGGTKRKASMIKVKDLVRSTSRSAPVTVRVLNQSLPISSDSSGYKLRLKSRLSSVKFAGSCRTDMQGISVRPLFPGLVNFVPAVAYFFCLNLPAASSQPGNGLIKIPVRSFIS